MQRAATNQQADLPRILTSGWLDLLVLLAAAGPLIFPGKFPEFATFIALGLLIVPFINRYWQTGTFIRYAHVNWLVLSLLLVFLPLSLIVSPLPMTISLPRATTLLWSIALFFTFANWPEDVAGNRHGRTKFTLPTKLYLLLGVVVAVVGLLGMQSVDKLFYLPLPDLNFHWSVFGNGLATNEVAGSLTLFVPFAAALALGGLAAGRNRIVGLTGLITLFLMGVMMLSQSRTALFATGLSLLVAAYLLTRPGWKWLAAGLVAVGAAVVIALLTGLSDRIVYAGANSWDSVIGPRLDVWQQGLFALRDFALWGTGLGMFGTLSPRLYPLAPISQAKILEDAHNLYLQSMLDFGAIGGLIFIAILIYAIVVLVRLVRHRKTRTMGRAWAVGLLAALMAHMLYSLTDAVAAGTMAGIPLWFLLGLTMARTHDTRPKLTPAHVAIVGTLAVALVGGLAWITYPTNQAARVTAAALIQGKNQSEAAATMATAADARCDLHWQEGLLYDALAQPASRDGAWATLLSCTDRFARFMPALAPGNAPLAQEMIERQPGNPTGYFWLAEILTPTDPATAIAWYQNGLQLAPKDGRRWGYLGDLLVNSDPEAALAAYLQSCQNGDPGANGCLRAGSLAEKQGKFEDAISYYRLSKYSGSLAKADELELQLAAQK